MLERQVEHEDQSKLNPTLSLQMVKMLMKQVSDMSVVLHVPTSSKFLFSLALHAGMASKST